MTIQCLLQVILHRISLMIVKVKIEEQRLTNLSALTNLDMLWKTR